MKEFHNFKQFNEIHFEGKNAFLSGKNICTVGKKNKFFIHKMFFMNVFYFVSINHIHIKIDPNF